MIMILKKSSALIIAIILTLCLADFFMIKSIETKPMSAISELNKAVIVDAGHGWPDGGVSGADGTAECDLNLIIAKKLVPLLEQSGCKVIMTRTEKNGIYDSTARTIREKKVSDMHKRKDIRDNSSADVFISIHQNHFEQSKYYGAQVMYDKDNPEASRLASCIQKQLINVLDNNNKRKPAPAASSKFITNSAPIPTVIVECGFMSNPKELELLKTDSYQDQVAWAIYLGIVNYFTQ